MYLQVQMNINVLQVLQNKIIPAVSHSYSYHYTAESVHLVLVAIAYLANAIEIMMVV